MRVLHSIRSLRSLRSGLVALFVLASFGAATVVTADGSDEGLPMPDPNARLTEVLAAARPDGWACAYSLGRPDAERLSVTPTFTLDPRGRLRVELPDASRARDPELVCMTRVVRRAVSRARPRLRGPASVSFEPFASMPQPFRADGIPVLVQRADVSALHDALRTARDDAARLEMLVAEVANGRAAPGGATALVAPFRTRKVEAALTLCGYLVGDSVRADLAALVPANQRAYFLAVTEAGCGVTVPEGQRLQPAPPPPECAVDADCVAITRAPPSCCGNSCRGGVAVPRTQAAALSAQCADGHPRQCPAMACAYQPGYPACVRGQCTMTDLRGPLR